MSEHGRQLHAEWTAADKHARAAELIVAREWDAYFAGTGPAPSAAGALEVVRLRATAGVKLAELTKYLSRPSRP